MPKGYAIFTSNVRDQTRLVEYIQAATPSVIEAGGNLLVAGAPERLLEGEWHGNRTAILEFPTVEAAQHWYDCADTDAQPRCTRARSSVASRFTHEETGSAA